LSADCPLRWPPSCAHREATCSVGTLFSTIGTRRLSRNTWPHLVSAQLSRANPLQIPSLALKLLCNASLLPAKCTKNASRRLQECRSWRGLYPPRGNGFRLCRLRILMSLQKRLLNTHGEQHPDLTITLDGAAEPAISGELLVETVNRALPGRNLAQFCYRVSRAIGSMASSEKLLVRLTSAAFVDA